MWAISFTGVILALASIGMFIWSKVSEEDITGEEE